VRRNTEVSRRSVRGVAAPSESDRSRRLRVSFLVFWHARVAPLLRFSAPSAPVCHRVHSPRVCLTRYVPSSGFRTLLTASSSMTLPALFHAGALLEFHPSERSPRPEPRRLSTPHLPSCRCHAQCSNARPKARLGNSVTAARRHTTESRSAAQPVHDRITTPLRRSRLQGLCSPGRVRCRRAGCYTCASPVALLGLMTCCDMASASRPVRRSARGASLVRSPLLPATARRPWRQRRAFTPRRFHNSEAGGSPVETTADSSVGLPRRRPSS
jgi:hypothetical protein